MQVQSLGQEDPLEKGMASHSTTALSNSMKLSHACGATQNGRVMVERSDRMWSIGKTGASQLAQVVKNLPANAGATGDTGSVRFLGQEEPLERKKQPTPVSLLG